jgi:D-lactate dehydrogenase
MDSSSSFQELLEDLRRFLPSERLINDPLRLLAYGTDASFYRLIPKLVVKLETENEVIHLLEALAPYGIPVTFRAAGTSLSGQSVTDSVLGVLAWGWKDCRIEDEGRTIVLQPGVIGGHANRMLAAHGRKIGPDPASIHSAMIGGIAANNASGMCCGTDQNSYRTLKSMRVVLADGSLLDTGSTESRDAFAKSRPDLLEGVKRLSEQVRGNPELSELIHRKYKIKNTTGYSLNALLDFEDPFEILEHLMIGSEGTLGFIAEITYHTVPEPAFKSTAFLLFPDLVEACDTVAGLRGKGVQAVELIDRSGLRSVENQSGAPESIRNLGDDACALLVECAAETENERSLKQAAVEKVLADCSLLEPADFRTDPKESEALWKLRKGLFPSVGSVRETGSTVVIEDVAVQIESLAELAGSLQQLFRKHGYEKAVIFGHALEGNLHFVFTPDFNLPEEVKRYESFMDEVCELVAGKLAGSLKAEHGTGRNMAPFVEKEWGREAYALMKKIKQLFDPEKLLNPGVILNDNPRVHLENLKPLPEADPIIDKCIECGFCEIHCPSRDLSLSPRQRITAWRELKKLERDGNDGERATEMAKAYRYAGIETCATDGLCATSCPVGIDTGRLIKKLRHNRQSAWSKKQADWIADNLAVISRAARVGLALADLSGSLLGRQNIAMLSQAAHRISGGRIPRWNAYLPGAAAGLPSLPDLPQVLPEGQEVIYLPSCLCRTLGPSADKRDRSVPQTVLAVLQKSGCSVAYPPLPERLCCGMAFDSKGFKETGKRKLKELEEALEKATRSGEVPVLCDTSPCAQRMVTELPAHLHVYDPVGFIYHFLLERLDLQPLEETVLLHPVCSVKKLGLETQLLEIGRRCAKKAVIPDDSDSGCCGFAGDRGITFPELNASALKGLREKVPEDCRKGYSSSRMCEVGLSHHSGITYQSLFSLLDAASR